MPLIRVETTDSLTTETKQHLCAHLSKLCASTLGKPESYVMVSMVDGCTMVMAGKEGPAAFVDIRSIGGLSSRTNGSLAEGVCKLLTEATKVLGNRVYLNFTNVDAGNWGHDGATFG